MLSRGKLVQDWRRRLAAAEADGAEGERRTWLAQMRLRLYRFLISCYQDADWRADEPAVMNDDTVADVAHGNTTTLLDVCLDGKPAKTVGKMQAVLKSVSAAQDHPAVAGPLLGGIAADEWVVAVSARDKLKMAGCQELLLQHGIVSTWTMLGEIKVRLFDLQRATGLIRTYRDSLKVEPPMPTLYSRPPVGIVSPWPICITAIVIAPIGAIAGLLFTQCALVMMRMQILDGANIGWWLAICYFVSLEICVFRMLSRELRRRNDERRDMRELLAAKNESLPHQVIDNEN